MLFIQFGWILTEWFRHFVWRLPVKLREPPLRLFFLAAAAPAGRAERL